MAAENSKLNQLHEKLAEVLLEAMEGTQMPDFVDPDTGEVIPGMKVSPSASVMTVVAKFLKDNNVTAVPTDDNALGAIRKLQEERAARRAARKQAQPVSSTVDAHDLEIGREQMGFLNRNI